MSLRLLRAVALLTAFTSLCGVTIAAPATGVAPAPVLPAQFAGWTETAPAQTTAAPETADAANADVLREYGLKEFAAATYAHGRQTVTVHAFLFPDATGAYGAFTFYRRPQLNQPQMKAVDLGKEGAESGSHAIFWKGATVVDAVFGSGATDRAALQALAAAIAQPGGPEGVPPSLPHYLPAEGLEKSSVRYSIGPAAYARGGAVLPAEIVNFSTDAEALSAEYALHGGKGMLTLLMYPTPQIAADRLRAIQALSNNSVLPGNGGAALEERRSGPLVAVTSGGFAHEEAQRLLDQVKFDDTVTINHPEGYVSEVAKTAKVLKSIAVLTVVLCSAAVLLGLFLGGGRAAIRVMRGKPASSLGDEEFISLRLSGRTETRPAAPRQG